MKLNFDLLKKQQQNYDEDFLNFWNWSPVMLAEKKNSWKVWGKVSSSEIQKFECNVLILAASDMKEIFFQFSFTFKLLSQIEDEILMFKGFPCEVRGRVEGVSVLTCLIYLARNLNFSIRFSRLHVDITL